MITYLIRKYHYKIILFLAISNNRILLRIRLKVSKKVFFLSNNLLVLIPLFLPNFLIFNYYEDDGRLLREEVFFQV